MPSILMENFSHKADQEEDTNGEGNDAPAQVTLLYYIEILLQYPLHMCSFIHNIW